MRTFYDKRAAVAPALADLTLYAKQVKLHRTYLWDYGKHLYQQRYLDDMIIIDDNDVPDDEIQQHFLPFKLSRVRESRHPNLHTFLGWEISDEGDHRIHYKQTFCNRFTPLYSGLKTEHSLAYFMAQVIRIGVLTSQQDWFEEDLKFWTEGLPSRGWPSELIRGLIQFFRDVHEVTTNPNWHECFEPYRTWLWETQSYRRDNKEKSPFKELWKTCFAVGGGYFEQVEMPLDDIARLMPYIHGDKFKIDTIAMWQELKTTTPQLVKHFNKSIGSPYRGTKSNTALASKTFHYYDRRYQRYDRLLKEEPELC